MRFVWYSIRVHIWNILAHGRSRKICRRVFVVEVILRYVFISIFGGFILGFLGGLIAAIIYNISAKVFGGIKIQVE